MTKEELLVACDKSILTGKVRETMAVITAYLSSCAEVSIQMSGNWLPASHFTHIYERRLKSSSKQENKNQCLSECVQTLRAMPPDTPIRMVMTTTPRSLAGSLTSRSSSLRVLAWVSWSRRRRSLWPCPCWLGKPVANGPSPSALP